MKWLGVLLLPHGWGSSPSQGTEYEVTGSITTVNSHLADTSLLQDTPLIRTAAKSPAKVTDVWLKQTPAIMDSRCYELTDTFSPDGTILLFFNALVTMDSKRNFWHWKNKNRFVVIDLLVQYTLIIVGNHKDW